MYVVRIFLDTSTLYKDPFWKGNFANELLQLAQGNQIDMYLSRVVANELVRNYGKIIDEENAKISKIQSAWQSFDFVGQSVGLIDKAESIKRLKYFYEDLYLRGILTVLEYDNDLLPEIVNRAVYRQKPFTENKTELKDALIWLTYAKFVEEYELENCVFVTDNISDFCDTDKISIHNDLLKDTKRFSVCRSIKQLLQNQKENLRVESEKFEKWVNQQEFDSNFLVKLLRTDFGDELKKFVRNEFEYANLNYIFKTNYNIEGFLNFSDTFYLHDVNNIETDIFGEQCIISGQAIISCNAQGFEYLSQRDMISVQKDYLNQDDVEHPGFVEDFHLFNEKEIYFKVQFSFSYDSDSVPSNLNVDFAEII